MNLAGFDVSTTAPVIANIKRAITAARAAGIKVIFFQNGWDNQYVEAGGEGSPNWHKSNALKTMRQRPELMGKLLAKGDWDYDLVDELQPQPGDIVLPKPRYSGFFNTQLDSLLRSYGIHHLVFTGIATNVCVESTLRDDFSSSISALCWPTPPTRPARRSPNRRRCTTSKPFSAGCRTSTVSVTFSPLRLARRHECCLFKPKKPSPGARQCQKQ